MGGGTVALEEKFLEYEPLNFIELFKRLHKSLAVDPQYSSLNPSLQRIIYSFRIRGPVNGKTGEQAHFGCETPIEYINNIIGGFASALKTLYPEFLSVETSSSGNFEMKTEIKILYHAQTKKEFNRIWDFLKKVPLEGGDFPKKDQTFFCYD